MASNQQLRQSELFGGQNWDVVYKAFSNVSLNSYDYDTIKQSMITYIQTNYAESFNDWISSSEVIMLIDLIAYLGQALAFRTDLNARENFMDLAERRESILRIAKSLNYTPKRNFPARGLLKLTKIRTDQEVRDSDGSNLTNTDISWNDPTNLNWYEQFITILNSVFVSSNPFGVPTNQSLIGGITTQLYNMNTVPLSTVVDPYNVSINGTSTRFEVVNPDFDPLGFFTERSPNPISGKNLIYRNDGAGNSSPNTGFFSYFKQGNLQYADYQFDYPQENRIVDINVDNINNLDVWVEEINESGLVIKTWTQVPTTDNIAFTNTDRQNRTIFSVITRDNDQVSIKFGDGRFGQAPTGLFRVWYRTSNGLKYQIRSSDMNNVQIVIPYLISNSNVNQQHNLTLTYSLQYGLTSRDVGASVPRETNDQIQQRASQVYYTQNRMVNGEDYNVFPLQYGNLARKVKAVNRVYSGQSRYIDVNDPTGRYQNTNIFSDDGIIYKELYNRTSFETLPSVKTPTEIITDDLQPLLNQLDLRDFFLANYTRTAINNNPYPTRWRTPASMTSSLTGEFVYDPTFTASFDPVPIGPGASDNYVFLRQGSLSRFVNPNNSSEYVWVGIDQVTGNGTDQNMDITGVGPVVLSQPILDNWIVDITIPSFRQTLSSLEVTSIEQQIQNFATFAIRYDAETAQWYVITASNINFSSPFNLGSAGDASNTNLDASWLLLAEYLPSQGYWQFSTRNLRYVFESVNDARFFFVNNFKVVDIQRNLPLRDYIKILKFNTFNTPSSSSLGQAYSFQLIDSFVYADGFIEPRRVQISFTDSYDTGFPDDPDIFDLIVDPDTDIAGSDIRQRYIYQTLTTIDDYDYFIPDDSILTFGAFSEITNETLTTNQIGYVIVEQKFYLRTSNGSLENVTTNHKAYLGRNNLAFQWKHYVPSDQRIDPSKSNIMDMYVLTENYYQTVQTWLTSVNRGEFPSPPTTEDLRQQFYPLENAKMESDEMIWHSAKFKLLFGEDAQQELRAKFKVIKVRGTTVTDNEIKQMVINAVNQFFNVNNWNFGETFYATEMAAYVHQQMSTIIASIVIVPNVETSKFGSLFVIRAEPDELFANTATVNDVVVVDNFTQGNIRIGQ